MAWIYRYIDKADNIQAINLGNVSRTDAEYIESHLIALYKTHRYYNVAKSGWGVSKFIQIDEQRWSDYEDIADSIPATARPITSRNSKSVKKDSNGRILLAGESQLKRGMYRYRYTDSGGVRRDLYSSRLLPTDELPNGCKNDLSLREKEDRLRKEVVTLNDIVSEYINGKTDVGQRTMYNYTYAHRRYIQDSIGNMTITDIKKQTVRKFYEDLLSDGRGISVVGLIQTVLFPAFSLAIEKGYIYDNPSYGVAKEIRSKNCA